MSSNDIYANRAVKNTTFEVAETDPSKHPWNEKQNGDPTAYYTAEHKVHARAVWMDAIPVTPPGSSTATVEVGTYDVFLNTESIPDNFRSYVTVASGGTVNSVPVNSFINPVLFGDAYRPKLYYYSGSAWVEIPLGTFDWQFNCNSGSLITTNGALTPSTLGYWRVAAYRYTGDNLSSFLTANGFIGTVQDSAGAVVVNNVNDLKFDASTFTVTDDGGGAATVSIGGSGTISQFTERDKTVISTVPTTAITLSNASKVFAANLALVYINGMFATYTDDYTIAGSTASGSPTVLTWTGTAMGSPYSLKVGDIVEVLY